ncbi:unnamed protein product, partial [Ectocarpus sp. 4 AP-2014]
PLPPSGVVHPCRNHSSPRCISLRYCCVDFGLASSVAHSRDAYAVEDLTGLLLSSRVGLAFHICHIWRPWYDLVVFFYVTTRPEVEEPRGTQVIVWVVGAARWCGCGE